MTSKLIVVMKREYVTRVRTRGFVLFTILIPLLIGGMIFVQVRIAESAGNQAERLAVVDLSGRLLPQLRQALDEKLPDGREKYSVEAVDATPATLPQVREDLRRQVLAGTEDGYLIIPADVFQTHSAEFHTRNAGALVEHNLLQAHLGTALMRASLEAQGIGAGQMSNLFQSFDLEQLKVGAEGERVDRGQTFVLAWVLGGLLYMTMILYGVTVMRGVTEEKTSRVSEILLSSVDAFTLMLGKILGIAGMGLTQYLIWGACLAIALGYGGLLANAASGGALASQLPHIGLGLYVSFVVYFVLGFLVYASLYAAIGAMVSSEQEAQQSQLPVTLLLVVGFLSAGTVLNNPSSGLAIVLSMVPFFAPILMVMRETVSNPPLWQILLSLLLCVGTLLALVKATAKIYRVGVLMTGKRPTLPELLKWLRYA